ncbi:hypothetical protein ACFW9D_21990 [Streptomyces sp. NPDC059524]|uniref:Rv1733c family protein n=1 Tax=Streptomyces sp. NPDC059524 TaxID=3346856 RepID=UPI003692F334
MWRRTTPDPSNPLLRKADRTRARLRSALVPVCLVAVACGGTAGGAAWDAGRRSAAEVAQHRHLLPATTVSPRIYRSAAQPESAPDIVARATWHDRAGRVHTGTVPVTATTRTGDTVMTWTDDRGNAAGAPPGTTDITMAAIGYGVGASCVVALAAGAFVRVRLRRVDARCARDWAAEWADVEPAWSGRLRRGPGQGPGEG